MSPTRPIIITGPDRSGTTLLYALLASHPRISMVRRTNLWRWFFGRYGDLSQPANLNACLDTMLRYPRLSALAPDMARLRSDFLAGESSYGRLFDLFHAQHAERRGRARWGDKSLHTEYYADRIIAELPEVRMLHLVRDPRDRYASILRRYQDRDKGIGAAMGRWLASIRQGRRNLTSYGANYRLVRYESLAQDPEASIRGICEFLEEEYDPTMLTLGGVSDHDDWSGNSSFEQFDPGVISTRSIGRYRSVLAPSDVAFIQACAGEPMREHAYRLEALQMSMLDRGRFFAVDLPLKAARLLGWLAMDHRSRAAGAGVPSHRLTTSATAASAP
jgi:hypothetical protein